MEQEWVLEPGDMLYLPPGVAHHGVALETGMTWSIGARAPSAADLLQGMGEWLAFLPDEGGRYSDPALDPAARAGEIDSSALRGLYELMQGALAGREGLEQFLAAFMSRFRLANEPAPPPGKIHADSVATALMNGATLMRNPWTRLVWIETAVGARLYAAGQPHDCSISLAESLCESARPNIESDTLDQASLEVVTSLINTGHFILEPDTV
jgi:50S ribosomal protein L16 3-hydroxylase